MDREPSIVYDNADAAHIGDRVGGDLMHVRGSQLPCRCLDDSGGMGVVGVGMTVKVRPDRKVRVRYAIGGMFVEDLSRQVLDYVALGPRPLSHPAVVRAVQPDAFDLRPQMPPAGGAGVRVPLNRSAVPPKAISNPFLGGRTRADVAFRSPDHEHLVGLELEHDAHAFVDYLGLSVRISGEDLCGAVMVAFDKVAVKQRVELGLVFFSQFLRRLPEVAPQFPEPELRPGCPVLAAIIKLDSRGTQAYGRPCVRVGYNGDDYCQNSAFVQGRHYGRDLQARPSSRSTTNGGPTDGQNAAAASRAIVMRLRISF